MTEASFCAGVAELAERYDHFLIDQWGVLHDGHAAYPDAIDCLRRLRAALAMVRDLVQLPDPLPADIEWLAGELGDARNWDVFLESVLPNLPVPDDQRGSLARIEAAAAVCERAAATSCGKKQGSTAVTALRSATTTLWVWNKSDV